MNKTNRAAFGILLILTSPLEAYDLVLGDDGPEHASQGGADRVYDALLVGAPAASSYSISGGSVTTDRIDVGHTGSGVFNHQAGNVTSTYENIGWQTAGAYHQNGGINTVGQILYMGSWDSPQGNGTYNLNDGTLKVGSEWIVGNGGLGTVVHQDGTATSNNVILGYYSPATGNYTLDGTGSLTTTGDLVVGRSGNGTFTQDNDASTVTVQGDLEVGTNGSSQGGSKYSLKRGYLDGGDDVIVGVSGQGFFEQTGGDMDITDNFDTGDATTAEGTATFSGGTSNIGGDGSIGKHGTGTWTISGDSEVTVEGYLDLGDDHPASSGTLTLAGAEGATLTVNKDLTIGDEGFGSYTQTGNVIKLMDGNASFESGAGSFLEVTDDLILGNHSGSSGIAIVSGGRADVTDEVWVGNSGSGEWFIQNGLVNVGNDLNLADYTGGVGEVTFSGGKVITGGQLGIGRIGQGTWTQSGAADAFIGGDLDLGDDDGGSDGTLNLQGGSLEVFGYTAVGDEGTGSIIQTGGTLKADKDMVLGNQAGSTGSYRLKDGELMGTEIKVGNAGSGTFTQTGGEIQVSSVIINDEFEYQDGTLASTSGLVVNAGGNLRISDHNADGKDVQANLTGVDVSLLGNLEFNNQTSTKTPTFSGRLDAMNGSTIEVGGSASAVGALAGGGSFSGEVGITGTGEFQLLASGGQPTTYIVDAGSSVSVDGGVKSVVIGPQSNLRNDGDFELTYQSGLVIAGTLSGASALDASDSSVTLDGGAVGISGGGRSFGRLLARDLMVNGASSVYGTINTDDVDLGVGQSLLLDGGLLDVAFETRLAGGQIFGANGGLLDTSALISLPNAGGSIVTADAAFFSLSVNGDLNIGGDILSVENGALTKGNWTAKSGKLTTSETVKHIGSQATLSLHEAGSWGQLDLQSVYGSLFINGQRSFSNNVDNHGKIFIQNAGGGSGVGFLGNFLNGGGLLDVSGHMDVSGSLNNSGTIFLPRGSRIQIGGELFIDPQGILKGDGEVKGKLRNGGKIELRSPTAVSNEVPNESPLMTNSLEEQLIAGLEETIASLTIDGDYEQTPDGQLLLEIAGTGAGIGYNVLSVTGDVVLDGELIVSFLDDFVPTPGDSFDFLLVEGSFSGNFDLVTIEGLEGTIDYDLNFDPNAGALSLSGLEITEDVSVISVAALYLLGLVGLGYRRQRLRSLQC